MEKPRAATPARPMLAKPPAPATSRPALVVRPHLKSRENAPPAPRAGIAGSMGSIPGRR
jgi:hypothetical protein